ncbi:hypothetical protein DNU06_00865 [Putridiphycobacter roseus]|uniref:Uncharacterized protein n=1 Tax=Putridiphycobacter roseus TaxID=2219161 RepID=A0A2W1NUI3_9FLAO|nr:hypothetical protein [Putridiphycobacter roseus]PZE18418.1 hypothetical protein DNU06_00865 [Putridiphycobacter roseus]
MKKVLLLGAILISTLIYAQNEVQIPNQVNVKENNVVLNGVERTGYSMGINGDTKDILKSFAAYLESKKSLDVKIKSAVIVGEDLMNTSISDKHFNIYAICNETSEGNELTYFMSYGTDIYVSQEAYPIESAIAIKTVNDFGKNYYSEIIQKQILTSTKAMNEANKALENVNDDISDVAKDKSKEAVKIEKIEKKKLKAEEKVRKLQNTIEEQGKGIAESQKTIEKLEANNTQLMTTKTTATTALSEAKESLSELTKKKATFQ